VIEFLDLLKALRPAGPARSCTRSATNFSPHRHARVRAWCEASRVELVFTPTYGSWLNWIEFAALRYFALNGTDHRSRRAERRHRWLRPLAQHPSTAQGRLRRRFTDPDVDRLPGQGCVTSH
jgi:transposase